MNKENTSIHEFDWKDFLKKGSYIAVTYESWFTDERPAESRQLR
jgi:hypothetical protein